MTIMLGGFIMYSENSIAELVKKETTNLTCISNNAGVDDFGLVCFCKNVKLKDDFILCWENAEFERQMLSGELEVDLIPQGTLAERSAQHRLELLLHQPVMELK
jgi:3-oxoacid CoA-transferase subunit A